MHSPFSSGIQMAPKKEVPAPPAPEEEPEEDLEEGEDDEFDEGEYDDDGMGFDIAGSLEPFLATEDGQTVATALVTISKHLETQNKILVKMLSKLSKD
jgi:hypothetical protein